VMKNNINDTRIDQNELKIILDEIERGCFDNQEQVFNEIYDRVIKPHLQKHGDFERELRELLKDVDFLETEELADKIKEILRE